MKKFLFFLMLFLVAVMVQPAQATQFTGEITGVYGTSPFDSLSVGDEFEWTATWSGTPGADGWLSADIVVIPVGTYQYTQADDEDLGFPTLHFTGSTLDGVDALALNWVWDGSLFYHFTTNTPLVLADYDNDGDLEFNFDYMTFSVYATEVPVEEYYQLVDQIGTFNLAKTEVLSGVLYGSPVPIPAPILLLGTGLVGLAGFRRKLRR